MAPGLRVPGAARVLGAVMGRIMAGEPATAVKHHLANARCKLGVTTTAQLVWILAPRLPEPEGVAERTYWTSTDA